MSRVVSIVPAHKDAATGAHSTMGTKVLLDDGSTLEGVTRITLVADVCDVWRATIEVIPTNQKQIDALLNLEQVVPVVRDEQGNTIDVSVMGHG